MNLLAQTTQENNQRILNDLANDPTARATEMAGQAIAIAMAFLAIFIGLVIFYFVKSRKKQATPQINAPLTKAGNFAFIAGIGFLIIVILLAVVIFTVISKWS